MKLVVVDMVLVIWIVVLSLMISQTTNFIDNSIEAGILLGLMMISHNR